MDAIFCLRTVLLQIFNSRSFLSSGKFLRAQICSPESFCLFCLWYHIPISAFAANDFRSFFLTWIFLNDFFICQSKACFHLSHFGHQTPGIQHSCLSTFVAVDFYFENFGNFWITLAQSGSWVKDILGISRLLRCQILWTLVTRFQA